MMFPAVVEVIRRASSIGTPPDTRVAMVRVIREMATFLRSSPNSGILRIQRSVTQRPCSVFRKYLNPTTRPMRPRKIMMMYFSTNRLSAMTKAVRAGSSAPSSMKMEAKTGMTFQSRKIATTTEKMRMALG